MLPAFACNLRIEPHSGVSIERAAEKVLESVLMWVASYYERFRIVAPEVEIVEDLKWDPRKALQTRLLRAESGEFHRSVLWTKPDDDRRPFFWSTRADLVFAEGVLDFQLLLGYDTADLELGFEPPPPYRPRLIPTLLEHTDWQCTQDGEVVTIHPLPLTGNDLERFCDERLFSPQRRLPLIVITPAEGTGRGGYPIPPGTLADRLAGVARVASVRSHAEAANLDRFVGPNLEIGPFSIRVFGPRLDPGDDGANHWLFRGDRIREAFPRKIGFADFLFASLAERSVTRFQESPVLRAFRRAVFRQAPEAARTIERLRADGARKESEWKELLEAADQEIRGLEAKSRALREEARSLRERLRAADFERDQAIENVADLSRELGRGVVPHAEPSLPSQAPRRVRDVVEEAKQSHSLVRYLDSALASAEQVPEGFKFVDRVVAALDALQECAAHRRDVGRIPGGFKGFFSQLGLEYKKLSDTARTRFADDYNFQFGKKRILFEEHFTIGTRSPNTCLSIHFHTRLDPVQIVVAYVGRHLPNTQS